MGDIAVQLPSCMDSQGCFLDPIQIKKSSAAKMRLADKTGNIALRKEAAAEQSFADRLGGRTALLSDELKAQIMKQKELAGLLPALTATPTTNAQGEVVVATEQSKAEEKVAVKQEKAPKQSITPQTTLPTAVTTSTVLPPEALLLKMDAATKQSIADKTGNLALKRTAALEQSLADKMAYASSSTTGASGITTAALHTNRKGFALDSKVFIPQSATQTANRQQQRKSPTPSPTPSPSSEHTSRTLPVAQPQANATPKYIPPALRNKVASPPQQHQQVSPPQQNVPTQQAAPMKWNTPNQPTNPTLQQSMDKRKQRLAQRQQPQPTSTSPTPRATTPPPCTTCTCQHNKQQEVHIKVEPVVQHSLAPAGAAM